MKKKTVKKLVLAKETLSILESEVVHGGSASDCWSACYLYECTDKKWSFTC